MKYSHWQKIIDDSKEQRKMWLAFYGATEFKYHLKAIVSGILELEERIIPVKNCPIIVELCPPPLDPAKYRRNLGRREPGVPTTEGAALLFETHFIIDSIPDCYYKGEYITLDMTKVTAGTGWIEFASAIATHSRCCPMFSIPSDPQPFKIMPANWTPTQAETKPASPSAIKDLTIRRITPDERPQRADMRDKQ
ncbi:hypothetical protein HY605_00580 [Candidatus Peregrinibacteria bacterium]|nr:hypothetical protein [Candidatus Peregrinibacteria bacterium]